VCACASCDSTDRHVLSNSRWSVAAAARPFRGGAPILWIPRWCARRDASRFLPATPWFVRWGCGCRPRREIDTTRSAAALSCAERLAGAILRSARATALSLLEMLDIAAERRDLRHPVGFVGAAESRMRLRPYSRGVPYLIVRGPHRRQRDGGRASCAPEGSLDAKVRNEGA